MILIGFMGSGKSTIGKRTAEALSLPFIEMDDLILQRRACKDMAALFSEGGELLLRESEIALAKECRQAPKSIVSTGGGIVLNQICLDYLKQRHGKVLFLHASFATLTARLEGDQSRPLFIHQEEAHALYLFRNPLYYQYADHVINVDQKSIEEIVWEVIHLAESLPLPLGASPMEKR